MSRRTSILKAIVEKLKLIDGNQPYNTNVYSNVYPILKFWDEVNDFPCIYSSTGSETRDYLPGAFTWAYLGISLKVYCKGEDAQEQLEQLLEDVESVIISCSKENEGFSPSQNAKEVLEIASKLMDIIACISDAKVRNPYIEG
jgi:adenine-specific DNA methylase